MDYYERVRQQIARIKETYNGVPHSFDPNYYAVETKSYAFGAWNVHTYPYSFADIEDAKRYAENELKLKIPYRIVLCIW